MKKQLILLSLAACSAAIASENSGNIRNIIEQKAQNKNYLQYVANEQLFAYENAVAAEKKREEQESLSYMAKQLYNGVKTFVSAPVKTTYEFVQPKLDALKSKVSNLALGNKLTHAKDATVKSFTAVFKKQAQMINAASKAVSETDAFKYVRSKYETALNSTVGQKASEYANRGVAFVSEHRNKIAALAAGAAVVGISAWLVKKYFEKPADPELVAQCLSGMIGMAEHARAHNIPTKHPLRSYGEAVKGWAQEVGYDNKVIAAAMVEFHKYEKPYLIPMQIQQK